MQNGNHEQGQPPFNEPSGPPGNAANPLADNGTAPNGPEGLLDQRADKYIREVAPIEDYPDDQDQQDMEQVIKEQAAGEEAAGSNI
ncbi:MAG TPA: hypothetical protein VGB56_00820 [Flavisolibacter sp.]|jgi:cellulase/cellobiase CelA1